MKNLKRLKLFCIIPIMLILAFGHLVQAQDEKIDYNSIVPKFTFPSTLEEQKEALRTNPLILRFAESRKKLANNPYRPIYHYVNPEGNLNDPNGLCFWQGKWHLFYQAYPPEDPRQHWGHVVSDDLIHWRDLPYAIYPNPEEKVFSGSTLVEDDRVIAIYHGIKQGTMVAISEDPLLLNWRKLTGKAVIPLPKPGEEVLYNVFDPTIWKKGDYYYALTAGTKSTGPGGKKLRAEYLHRSEDLKTWEYLHPFLENDQYGLVGDDGACPYFWPIGKKHILLHFSHMSGGKYLIGEYEKERDKFVVINGGDFNHGAVGPGGVHAPSAYPDGKGGVYVIFNMNPAKPTAGWNQIMSLPRHLSLDDKDNLIMKPVKMIESLRYNHNMENPRVLPANEELVFENIKGNALEVELEIDPGNADVVELNVLRSPDKKEFTKISLYKKRGFRGKSVVTLDNSHSSILPAVRSRPPENAQIRLGDDENFKIRIFVDKSIVEVFVNDKQCVATRVYPGRNDSIGFSILSKNNDSRLVSLNSYSMKSIYD